MAGDQAGADRAAELTAAVVAAVESRTPLDIVGGGSKGFLGHPGNGQPLQTGGHRGIVSYEPGELFVTVRAGTPLAELVAVLAEAGQMLPFEPPLIPGATVGGSLACGLSGPRRPFAGSARDHILGVRTINGQGQALRFGGEVMKNVAGYDVSRLQVGAFGTLGVLLDASLKVLPRPEIERTVQHESADLNDLAPLVALARQPLPLSAALVHGYRRFVRLSGSASAVADARTRIGGEEVADADALWASVRNMTHPFFDDPRPTWRLAMAAHAPAMALPGDWLLDWGGAQRWLKTEAPAYQVFAAARTAGGHATRFSPDETIWQPMEGPMRRLQARVRNSFDPHRLFNRGRFHPELDRLDDEPAARTVN